MTTEQATALSDGVLALEALSLAGLLAATGIAAALGGVIQPAGIDVGGLLNHHVLYHLCAMLALAGFWAAARIWDRTGTPKPSTSAAVVVSEDSAP